MYEIKEGKDLILEALGHHFNLDPLLSSEKRKLLKEARKLSEEEINDITLKYRDMILNMKPIQKLGWDIDKRAQCQRRARLQLIAMCKKTKRQLKKFREELENEIKPKKEKSK